MSDFFEAFLWARGQRCGLRTLFCHVGKGDTRQMLLERIDVDCARDLRQVEFGQAPPVEAASARLESERWFGI